MIDSKFNYLIAVSHFSKYFFSFLPLSRQKSLFFIRLTVRHHEEVY